MKHISPTFILSAAAFLMLQSCGQKAGKTGSPFAEDTIPVKVIQLQQTASSNVIPATGLFTTDDETLLSFKTGGVVSRIYVKEGDAVSKGQLLATVNPTEVEAGVQQVELAYQKAERDYQRAVQLYKDSVATLEQMENAKTALDVAKQQREAARFNKQYTEIRATASGYVLKRFMSEGQMAGPGMPVLMINGARQNNWLLKVGVSDVQWAAIKVGDNAEISIDAAPGKKIKATVFKKSEGLDPASGTFSVQLRLAESVQNIASGMFARAEIYTRDKVSAWTVPYDAVLDGDGKMGFVFVTSDNQTAKKVEVAIGEVRHDNILITGGLENAGSLIVSGSAYLNDGSPIRIQDK